MNHLSKQVGHTVMMLRQQQQLLQRDLSKRTGLPVRTIGRIERGEVDPRLSSLAKIAEALTVNLQDLFK